MKPIPKFTGAIKKGKLTYNVASLKRWLLTLKDGPVEIIVRPFKKDRSQPQNRYYWGVVLKTIGNHLGYTADEMHQIFGTMFLSYEKNGRVFVMSTTKLTTVEFEDYLAEIKQWSAVEQQCFIPDPNDVEH